MNIDQLLGEGCVGVSLIGAGQFGAAMIGQARHVPGLELKVVCDLDPDAAGALCEEAGFATVRRADSATEIASAVAAGAVAITADATAAASAPVDIVVEATGQADAAASCAITAIAAGRHMAMVTKEAESVVGPELHARAAEAGVVYTPVDGDQPSLLIGLIGWARRLGLEIVCAGKSSEYDFVFDHDTESVHWLDRRITVPGFAAQFERIKGAAQEPIEQRAKSLSALPKRTVPDLTEMVVVANATDLNPDTASFHVPIARTVEVPGVFRPKRDGGLLNRTGVIDVFNCLRRPDEASFAGGVFVVVRCRDRATWQLLADKGHPVSDDGGYAMLYNPQHLLGLEAPTTLLSAVLQGKSTGNPDARPRYDVVARAARDWAEGEVLAITNAHHHEVSGLDPLVLPAAAVGNDNALPYYLATDRPLKRPLARGELLTASHVALDDGALLELRYAQDRRFF